jgi:hypothetical protein
MVPFPAVFPPHNKAWLAQDKLPPMLLPRREQAELE